MIGNQREYFWRGDHTMKGGGVCEGNGEDWLVLDTEDVLEILNKQRRENIDLEARIAELEADKARALVDVRALRADGGHAADCNLRLEWQSADIGCDCGYTAAWDRVVASLDAAMKPTD